jgi:hypothetical protein
VLKTLRWRFLGIVLVALCVWSWVRVLGDLPQVPSSWFHLARATAAWVGPDIVAPVIVGYIAGPLGVLILVGVLGPRSETPRPGAQQRETPVIAKPGG